MLPPLPLQPEPSREHPAPGQQERCVVLQGHRFDGARKQRPRHEPAKRKQQDCASPPANIAQLRRFDRANEHRKRHWQRREFIVMAHARQQHRAERTHQRQSCERHAARIAHSPEQRPSETQAEGNQQHRQQLRLPRPFREALDGMISRPYIRRRRLRPHGMQEIREHLRPQPQQQQDVHHPQCHPARQVLPPGARLPGKQEHENRRKQFQLNRRAEQRIRPAAGPGSPAALKQIHAPRRARQCHHVELSPAQFEP